MSNQILQNWVANLSVFDQATLLAALRGIDEDTIADTIKPVVKMYRHLIGVEIVPKDKNNYSTYEVYNYKEMAYLIIIGRSYSNHWYEHFISAIKIVSKKHPNMYIKEYWKNVINMCR